MDNQLILKKQEARAFIMIKRDKNKNTGHFTVFIWAKYKYTEKTHSNSHDILYMQHL